MAVSALASDASGRLWIATADFEDEGRDALYVVADEGDAPIRIVADLHTPMGLLWHDDALYVSSAVGVDRYRGFDGARFASHERVLEVPEGVGNPGMLALSRSGRMLVGISAPCDNCVPASEHSAAILSFAPDGSDVQIFARGIRAPVGLAYYPNTDDLFATMNQRDDLDPQTPGDWLAVVRAGDWWGFPDCYGQGGVACANVPAPLATLDPHAALSGVAIVTGQLGAAIGSSAVVAEWAEGKVQRVALTKAGASYEATVVPFLTGLQNPVPVLLSENGSLFVGDWSTGDVFRIAHA
jgi:glucose/arabinose dehydrogenase